MIGTPGHSPDHVTYSIAAEKAIFSGDVLFQGSIGRTDLPGRRPPDADALDRARCWTRCPTRPACCPGHMDPTTLGHGAREQPVPARARAPVSRSRRRAARTTCCPTSRTSARRLEQTAAKILERAGYGRIETPTFEATQLFSADGGGGDRRRPEGDVHVPGRQRGQPDAAAGGHRAGRALLPRARHAQGAAAGEALVPVELLPLRAPAGRPLPAVLADRGGGDRVGRPGGGRRGDPAARPSCWRRSARATCKLVLATLGQPESRAAYREELERLPARERGPAQPRTSSTRIDLNPLRAFDAKHEPTQRVMANAPRLIDRLPQRGPRPLRRGPGPAAARPTSPTRSTRRSCAGSTTTRARCSSSSRARWRRRRTRSAAAAATTGWRRRSAARRRPAWAGRRASSGC